jgi:hypothetical protein
MEMCYSAVYAFLISLRDSQNPCYNDIISKTFDDELVELLNDFIESDEKFEECKSPKLIYNLYTFS